MIMFLLKQQTAILISLLSLSPSPSYIPGIYLPLFRPDEKGQLDTMARLVWIGTAMFMASTAAASGEKTRRYRNEIVHSKDHLVMEKVRNARSKQTSFAPSRVSCCCCSGCF